MTRILTAPHEFHFIEKKQVYKFVSFSKFNTYLTALLTNPHSAHTCLNAALI